MKRINIEAIRILIKEEIEACKEASKEEPANSHIGSLARGEIEGLYFALRLLEGKEE